MSDYDRKFLVGLLVRAKPQWSIGTCIQTVDAIVSYLPAIQRAKEAPCCIMKQDDLTRYERIGRDKFKALAKYLTDRGIGITMGSGDPRGPTVELTVPTDSGDMTYYMSGEGFTADQLARLERYAYV